MTYSENVNVRRGGWEVCERGAVRNEWPRPRVYVSLNRRGDIVMNAAAYAEIKEPSNVTLMFDRAKRLVGVKHPDPRDGQFFPVRRYGRGGRSRIIRAAKLLKQFGIEVEQTVVFSEPETAIFKGLPMLILKLGSGIRLAGGGR